MSSQLAAQLRILAGAGGATTGAPLAKSAAAAAAAGAPSALASSATLAAIQNAAPGSTASKYRASFLFRGDVAAATDSATVASLGASGFEQLGKLEPRLRPLAQQLTAPTHFDRDAHKPQQLAQMQAIINQAIQLMAPYFMLKPTHKVLEFLIRRYSVHIYNIPALLAAFLPYHESALFARLLQVLHLHLAVPVNSLGGAAAANTPEAEAHKLFGFLEGAQRAGVASITRHLLVQRCLNDAAFLRWLVSLVSLKSAAFLSSTSITFYTTLMLEMLSSLRATNNGNASDAKDALAHTVIVHALGVISAHVNATQHENAPASETTTPAPTAVAPPRELVFSALLLLSQAAAVTRFGGSLDTALFLLLKSVPSARGDQTLAHPVCRALLALTQHQHIASAPPKGVAALVASQGAESGSPFIATLAALGQQYDMAPLLHVLLPQLSTAHVGEQRKQVQLLLSDLITSLPLGASQVHSLVSSLLRAYEASYRESGAREWKSKDVSSLRKLMLLLQQRFTAHLEAVVQKLLQEDDSADAMTDAAESNGKARSPLLTLIKMLFEGSAHEVLLTATGEGNGSAASPEAAGSILTCLQSPLPHVRIRALQAVDSLDENALVGVDISDESGASLASHLGGAVLAQMADADGNIVRAALRLKTLPRLLPFDTLLGALSSVLARAGSTVESAALAHQSGSKIVEAAFKLAAKLVTQLTRAESEVSHEQQGVQLHALLTAVLPFLFEFALVRPAVGVSAKVARAVHALMTLLATLAERSHRHAHSASDDEEETPNGFVLCALFAQLPALPEDEELASAAGVHEYNSALVRAFSVNYVNTTSASGGAAEIAVLDAVARSAASAAAAARSANGQSAVTTLRSSAPSTAFVLLHMFNDAVQQLASQRKADAQHYLRVARAQHRALVSFWSAFGAEQRQTAVATPASGASSLVSPSSFVSSGAGASLTPRTFPAFVRCSLAHLLLSASVEFATTHAGALQSTGVPLLRELFAFFVADSESLRAFGAHLTLLCQTHLHAGQLQDTVQFLLPLLHGSGAGTAASVQVCVRSFHLLHALLQKQMASKASKVAKEQAAVLSELAASVLLAAASPARAVRHAALMAAPALVAALNAAPSEKKSGNNAALLSSLLSSLYSEKEELLSATAGGESSLASDASLRETAMDDSLHHLQAFMQKHMGDSPASNAALKSDSHRAELHRFLAALAGRMASSGGSSVWSGLRLLQLLRRLPHGRVADVQLPLLSTLLSSPLRASASIAVAVELLEQLDAAGFEADNAAAFRCLEQALQLAASGAEATEASASFASQTAVTAVQAAALSRLQPDLFALLNDEQQESLFAALLRLSARGTASVPAIVARLPFDSSVFVRRLQLESSAGSKKKAAAASTTPGLAGVQTTLELLQLKDPSVSLRVPFALLAPLFSLLQQLIALGAQSTATTPVSQLQTIEYVKQLSLAVLSRLLGAAPEEAGEVASTSSRKKTSGSRSSGYNTSAIDVPVVVSCLSAGGAGLSRSLAISVENTRSHALTLLALIGRTHPELLVEPLIPIFQTLLLHSAQDDAAEADAQDEAAPREEEEVAAAVTMLPAVGVSADANADPYSVRLLNRLITSVLPSMMRAGLPIDVWQLLGVFVDALAVPAAHDSKRSGANGAANSSAAGALPTARWLRLFHNLLTSLEVPTADVAATSSYLHTVVALLLAKSVCVKRAKAAAGAGAARASPVSAAELTEFAHLLCEQFGVEPAVQIDAFNRLLQLLSAHLSAEHKDLFAAAQQAPEVRLTKGSKSKAAAAAGPDGVSALAAALRTASQRSSWQKTVLLFVSTHLARLPFAQQVYLHSKRSQEEQLRQSSAPSDEEAAAAADESELQASFLRLFELLFARLRSSLQVSKQLAHRSSASSDDASTTLSAHFVLLSSHTKQALLHLNGLLTMPNFVSILQQLFKISAGVGAAGSKGQGRDVPLLQQALSLLHSKLLAYKDRAKIHAFASAGKGRRGGDEDDEAGDVDMSDAQDVERAAYFRSRKTEQRLLVSLLPSLQQLLAPHEDNSELSADEAAMKQSALLNLDVLAASFGHMRQFQADFVQLLPTILQLALNTPHQQKEASPAQAAATLVQSLGWQHVSTSALLCLATLISSFQTKAHVLLLEFVPLLVPNILALLLQLNLLSDAEEQEGAKQIAGRKRRHDAADEEEAVAPASRRRHRTLDTLVAPLLHLAALSVLQACIVSMPELLSPYLADLLRVLLSPAYHNDSNSAITSAAALLAASSGVPNASAVASAASAAVASVDAAAGSASVSSVDHASVSSVVSQSLASLISKIPSRTLLPYLFNHYKTAASEGYASLQRLFQLLALVVAGLQADAVKQHFKLIFKFFLAAAQQLRLSTITAAAACSDASGWPSSSLTDGTGCSLSQAEDALIAAFLELTMKLNETSFKGLFLKLLQWVGPIPDAEAGVSAMATSAPEAADGDEEAPSALSSSRARAQFLSRSLVLFKLIHQLTGKLKGIFVSYCGYILDHCVAFLRAADSGKVEAKAKQAHDSDDEEDEEELPAGKRRKAADGSARGSSASLAGSVPPELVDLVLLSLRNCFLYDTHHFFDKYHFQLLTAPMVHQLQHAADTRRSTEGAHKQQAFDDFISHVLTPTLVQMALRMGNYLQWKPLVHALLLHGRSSLSAVRRASAYVLQALLSGVGDNMLVVLPELLPWIAEMLEDADVGVVRNVQKLVKTIEKLSGESLDATLNGSAD